MQGSDTYRLVVRRGPQPNYTYDLNKDIITIGRDITNDIPINDPEVSRHHLRLTRGAAGFTLEDLGSTNGTFVNNTRLATPRPLQNGDLIGLGETVTLVYESARPGAPVGEPAAPAAPAYSPYAPPVAAQPPAPAPVQQPVNVAPVAPQPSSYGAPSAQAPYTPPPPAGYEYDPYAARDEEPRNYTRWVLIGCAGVTLVCCCASIASIVVVDALCLYDRIPLIGDIIRAIGWTVNC